MGVATRASRKPSPDAVGQLAPMIVGSVNFIVVQTQGVQCGLTDMEGKILIPSMQRMLERMPAAAAQKASWIIDPLVVLTVAILWFRRIAQIKDMEAKQKYQINPTEAARAAGATGFTYSVPTTEQQSTSPTQPIDLESVRREAMARDALRVSQQPVANAPATNGVAMYGAPDHIRESFASDAEF